MFFDDSERICEGYGGDQDCCGHESRGLTPVDCTEYGDMNSFCVYGDHCRCSDGYVCEDTGIPGECSSGVVCVEGKD